MTNDSIKTALLQPASERATWVTILIVSLVVAWGAACYVNSLDGEFVYDDSAFVAENDAVHSLDRPWRFFYETGAYARTGNFNIYRPLPSLSFAVNYHFSGKNPLPYHVVSYLLHLTTLALLFFLLRHVLRSDIVAGITVLLFAVHPRNTEVVSWIASRSNILFMVFFLAGFLCHLRAYRPGRAGVLFRTGSVLAYTLSIFSKEMGITYPALLLAYDLLLDRRKATAKPQKMFTYYLVLGLVALAYIGVRTWVLEGSVSQRGVHGANVWENIFFAISCVGTYVLMTFWTLWPVAISVDYPFPEIVSLAPTVFAFSALAIATLAIVAYACRKRQPVITFGLLWFFITVLPVANIIPIKTKVNDRFMYLPMVGLLICLAWLIFLLWKHTAFRTNVLIASASALLLVTALLSTQTILLNRTWHDNHTLFKRARELYPESTIARSGMGWHYIEQNQFEKAVQELEYYLQKTTRFGDPRALQMLAGAHSRLGHHDRAIEVLHFAIEALLQPKDPQRWMFYANLASVYRAADRFPEAVTWFRRSLQLNPRQPLAYLALGDIHFRQGRWHDCIAILEQGRRQFPTRLDILTELGRAYQQAGDPEQALRTWKQADTLHPNDSSIMNNLAWIYATSTAAEHRNHALALELASKAVTARPNNTGYLNTLACALEANGRIDEAIKIVQDILTRLPENDLDERPDNTELLERLKKKSAASGKPKTAD